MSVSKQCCGRQTDALVSASVTGQPVCQVLDRASVADGSAPAGATELYEAYVPLQTTRTNPNEKLVVMHDTTTRYLYLTDEILERIESGYIINPIPLCRIKLPQPSCIFSTN